MNNRTQTKRKMMYRKCLIKAKKIKNILKDINWKCKL